MRGPKYIRDKEVRKRVKQYNLKHKEDKTAEVSDDRLDKPTQGPTLPKANNLNSKFDETLELDVEYEQEEDEGYMKNMTKLKMTNMQKMIVYLYQQLVYVHNLRFRSIYIYIYIYIYAYIY